MGCKRYDRCIICVLFQISWQLRTQMVKHRILSDSLLGNKLYVKHMKKSEWLDCQRNEFFPKQKGIPSLVKIEHKNTATLDSARSKKKSKVAVLQLFHSLIILNCAVATTTF